MKKVIFIITVLAVFVNCKKVEEKPTEVAETANTELSETLITVSGEFLFLNDAAVLNTGKKVYGVVIDEKMHELDAKVKAFKKEDFDMIPVTVKGTVSAKPEGTEGWDEQFTIAEIVSVTAPSADNTTITIKSEQ